MLLRKERPPGPPAPSTNHHQLSSIYTPFEKPQELFSTFFIGGVGAAAPPKLPPERALQSSGVPFSALPLPPINHPLSSINFPAPAGAGGFPAASSSLGEANENSPQFRLRELAADDSSPAGTAENHSPTNPSNHPAQMPLPYQTHLLRLDLGCPVEKDETMTRLRRGMMPPADREPACLS